MMMMMMMMIMMTMMMMLMMMMMMQVHPSPEEFIRYILDRLRANKRQTDPHWRPQHLQVRLCHLTDDIVR